MNCFDLERMVGRHKKSTAPISSASDMGFSLGLPRGGGRGHA
jgi:hypothetical protein